jgi:heme/copper-type cytochrome/quinol oxidase subunit 3
LSKSKHIIPHTQLTQPKKNWLVSFFMYIKHPMEGNDNKLSGKRVMGTALIIMGMRVAWIGFQKYLGGGVPTLSEVVLLVTTLLGAGFALWGITAWSTMINRKMDIQSGNDNSGNDDTTKKVAPMGGDT